MDEKTPVRGRQERRDWTENWVRTEQIRSTFMIELFALYCVFVFFNSIQFFFFCKVLNAWPPDVCCSCSLKCSAHSLHSCPVRHVAMITEVHWGHMRSKCTFCLGEMLPEKHTSTDWWTCIHRFTRQLTSCMHWCISAWGNELCVHMWHWQHGWSHWIQH